MRSILVGISIGLLIVGAGILVVVLLLRGNIGPTPRTAGTRGAADAGSEARRARVASKPELSRSSGRASGSESDTAALKIAELRVLQHGGGNVHGVALSPDGHTVATTCQDNNVYLWHAYSGQRIRTLRGHTESPKCVAFSPDGRALATGSWDKTVRLWDVATGRELRQFRGHTGPLFHVAFSPDGRTLATGASDLYARLWDVSTGKEMRALPHTNSVDRLAFTRRGRVLATLQSGPRTGTVVRLWDVASAKQVRKLDLDGGVFSIAFSPKDVLAVDRVSGVLLWDTHTGNVSRLETQSTPVEVCFSPDGNVLALGNSSHVWLVDVRTGRELCRAASGCVGGLVFSPDGRLLAGPYNGGVWSARLWKVSGLPSEASRRVPAATPAQTAMRRPAVAKGRSSTTTANWPKLPQAKPVWMMFLAAKNGNAQTLKASSSRWVRGIVEGRSGWQKAVIRWQENVRSEIGLSYELSDFKFTYEGNNKEGIVYVTHTAKGFIAGTIPTKVCYEDGEWKANEP